MSHRICLLPGDGIGPEVIDSAEKVLQTICPDWELTRAPIGFSAYQLFGTPLPPETISEIRNSHAALLGAVTTPPNIPGYYSPIVRMRQELELFANIRPCRSIQHQFSRPGIDLVIVRENTEGLYSGIERLEDDGNRAVTERIITRKGSERIIRKAYEIAEQTSRNSIHIVHKANVLRQTCGLFRKVALEVAAEFPDIQTKEMLVDSCAMELIRNPEHFEVIVTTNLFGDILSDEASMLVGGLGVAASGNIGAQASVFEPVHGSAPDIAGKGIANPTATFLALVMLMEHLGETSLAHKLRAAVDACINNMQLTPDLGGILSTREMTAHLLYHLNNS